MVQNAIHASMDAKCAKMLQHVINVTQIIKKKVMCVHVLMANMMTKDNVKIVF